MELIIAPNDILNQKCTTVDKVDKTIKQQIKEMMILMRVYDGLGLASPQVGILNQLFVMDTTIVDSIGGYSGACINPMIMRKSNVRRDSVERCLSVPGKEITIKRPLEIIVKFRDGYSKMQYKTFKGISAAVFQHELNHLQGILFTSFEEKEH